MNSRPEEMTNQNAVHLDGPNPPSQSESSKHSSCNSLGSHSFCSEADLLDAHEAKIETCQEKKEEMTEQNANQLGGSNPPFRSESSRTHQSSVNLLGSQILSSETQQLLTQETKTETCQEKSEEKKEETGRLSSETTLEIQAENGRERLKRHRREVAGRVWIPDIWGQEDFLKDWSDCSVFDACLAPNGISRARAALVNEGKRASSGRLRVENRC